MTQNSPTMPHSPGERTTGSSIDELKDKGTQTFEKAAVQVGSLARSVSDQAQEVGDNVQAFGRDVNDTVQKSIKDRPMATLGVAAGLGFVAGALWKFVKARSSAIRGRSR